MQINIKVDPESLSANLGHLALALPIAVAIGALQVALSDSPAWWHAAYADVLQTNLTDVLVGLFSGLALLLLSTLTTLTWRSGTTDWVYKAFAAIPPSPRSIWLLSTFAAVFEEILFRAALIPIIGVVGSTIVFALLHIGLLLFAPNRTAALRVFVDLLVFGLAMGMLYESYGIVTCILAHLVHNIVAFHIARPIWARAHNDWAMRTGLVR